MEAEFATFLAQHEAKVKPLSIAYAECSYEAAVSGSDSLYTKAADFSVQLTKVYTDKKAFERIKQFKSSGLIKDSLLSRQLDILYLYFLGNQADTAILEDLIRKQSNIEKQFAAYRPVVGGKKLADNEIDDILRNSVNSQELEQVWNASKMIGSQVEKDVIALVRKRNELAKGLGFSNYHEMSLKLSEQDPAEVEKLFDELDVLTRDGFASVKTEIDSYLSKRFNMSTDELMPWHYQNRFFQEAPAIYSMNIDKYYENTDILKVTKDYYNGLQLPVDDIIDRSSLYEKEGKNQHAFCTDIDRSGDVRVLLNLRNNGYWMNTILHELGHGVYSKFNDPQLPYFLRDAAHTFTTEAIALMFGRFYSNPYWIRDNIGISNDEVNKIKTDCRNTLRLEQLLFSRWSQVMFRFEKAMYQNPDQDLNKLWWDLVEKYQLLKRPEGRNQPDWASKIHIATFPCYYHNYLLGDLLASQLYYYISENVLHSVPGEESFTNKPAVGKYLMENVFKPGMRYPWEEMIEKATGEKLTAKYYAKQFVNP
ncbi:MAG TPA: M2 family metallopeptidase [Bacteroidales bacterium]|nr:M2 family metallopeptidase [Bacteroidales bacterium]